MVKIQFFPLNGEQGGPVFGGFTVHVQYYFAFADDDRPVAKYRLCREKIQKKKKNRYYFRDGNRRTYTSYSYVNYYYPPPYRVRALTTLSRPLSNGLRCLTIFKLPGTLIF